MMNTSSFISADVSGRSALTVPTEQFNSPRPRPKFFESQILSTKKARATPREQLPPKPPVKSAPQLSRFFHKQPFRPAQAVSFRASETSTLSKHYDESCKELYFDQCFEIFGKIGAGSFGEVFKVMSKDDGKFYAVKRSKERFKGERDRLRKLEEVAKHEQLPKNSNCVEFVKAWEERGHLYIQTELCQTSLSNFCEQNHDIPEALIWNYLIDLLLAVKHLHDRNLIHLDIKPANIFISKAGVCKLGDFGLIFDLSKGNSSDALDGDPKYLAPEVIRESNFTKAADIFCLGISILELACDLDLPRNGDTWQDLRKGKLPFDMMQHLSSELQTIIQSMMNPNCKMRPTVNQLLAKPKIKKMWRMRRNKIFISSVLFTVKEKTCSLISRALDILKLVLQPLSRLLCLTRRSPPTPLPSPNSPVPPHHPSEWDYSYSDDDCFEDINISPISSPKIRINDSSESENGKLRNSTPTTNHNRLVGRRLSPIPFYDLDFDTADRLCFDRPLSASTSLSPSLSPSPSPTPLFLNRYNLPVIEPKNLKEMFEQMDD